MKLSPRLNLLCVVCGLFCVVIGTAAQLDKKPYTEWSDKDALKVLNNSPWSQTQTITDSSQAFIAPGTTPQPNSSRNSGSRSSDIVNVNFRVRFFSAKPVREAFCRLIELQMKEKLSDAAQAQLKTLMDTEFKDHIVISIDADSSSESKKAREVAAFLRKTTTSDLKNTTYLQVKGGERLFLQDYQPPSRDGFGAKLIFPRLVNGEPYIKAESGEIFLRSELSDLVNLSVRYKVKDMMYNGKLEY